ncbi:MAG: ferric reductase-like transmembrane domain-containing protein, partial [Aquabacterium sp.]
MKHIQLTLIGLILLLSGLWMAADTVWSDAFAIFNFRTSMLNYTGILAIGAMSVGMLLALRPRGRIETFLGGLDKSYRLHKWLGITALVTAIAHWLWVEGVKWAVGWGWLVKPARKGARPVYEGLQGWLAGQRGLAEDVGEWAFYAALVLIGLA